MSSDDQDPQAFGLWQRYKAIWKTAWASRVELDGVRKSLDETTFMPAALSLQETPPHPTPRRLAWILMLLFVLAVAWAFFGKVDVVAVAPGRIVVSERTKVIQPLETSVIRRILVKDGDRVKLGQLLVELDPTVAEADRKGIQEQYFAALSEETRTRALLQALDQGRLDRLVDRADGLPYDMLRQYVQAEWLDINSKRSRLEAEAHRKEAELLTALALLEKVKEVVPLAQQREKDFDALVIQGFISGHATQDRKRERIELERDLGTQSARVKEAQAAVAESTMALKAYLAEVRRSLNDRHQLSSSQRVQLEAEANKAAKRESLTQLVSPIDGVVQQVAIHSVGGVVTSAQAVMAVVPETEQLTALVQVANMDIGFVHKGQRVTVKLETFPYTLYGTIPAEIAVLGADAVVDEQTGISTFPATIALSRTHVYVDQKAVPISPGMNVTAEIITGQRRIIQFLLSPVLRTFNEGLRER